MMISRLSRGASGLMLATSLFGGFAASAINLAPSASATTVGSVTVPNNVVEPDLGIYGKGYGPTNVGTSDRADGYKACVENIQRALTAKGFRTGVDGVIGSQTDTEIRRFQASRHLTADGVVGAATAKALGLTFANVGLG